MAKTKLAKKKTEEQKTDKVVYDVFKDPGETLIGKIVVGLILFGTIAGIVIGAIIAVVEFFN